MAALALKNIKLPGVGIESEAVQVRLATRDQDLFLVSLPVRQLIDRKYQSALNKKAVPLLDAVNLGEPRDAALLTAAKLTPSDFAASVRL